MPILLPRQEIVTIISLHLERFATGQVHALSALIDCNIPHNRQVPDTLWSTKQIEIKYLAQGHKHAGRSGARTHNIDGLVIMSPALFPLDHACSQSFEMLTEEECKRSRTHPCNGRMCKHFVVDISSNL